MVTIAIQGRMAVFSLQGLHRLWAFRREIEVRLAHILDVRPADPALLGRRWKGVRLLGTAVPGHLAAGAFYRNGRLTFWDVGSHPERAIQVILTNETFSELIVEVADPLSEVARFQSAPLT